jgi:septal ring factor EnvC (AmiA/AmiB activator)
MHRHIRLFIISAFLLLLSAGVSAQDVTTQQQRREKLEREIAIIDKQLAANASQSRSLDNDLMLIRKKISNRKALVADSDRQVRQYSDSIYLTNLAINRINARIDTLTAHYSRLVLSAYKNRDTRVWYMYMFASENLGQAFRRFGYFRNLSTTMKNEATRIKEMKEELRLKKERLAVLKKEAESVKAERVKELDRLKQIFLVNTRNYLQNDATSGWKTCLVGQLKNNESMTDLENYEGILFSITPEDIREGFRKLVNTDDHIIVSIGDFNP